MNCQILLTGIFTILGAIIGGCFGLFQAHIQNRNQVSLTKETIKNQELLTRAIDTENKRPRFAISTTNSPQFDKPCILLFKDKMDEEQAKIIANTPQKPFKIVIKNISDNNLLDIEASITYHFEDPNKEDKHIKEYHDIFEHEGLNKNESIMLIPKIFLNDIRENIFYDSLVIKFFSSAGETGYVKCSIIKMPGRIGASHYYFVKGQNSKVTSQEMGKMIDSNGKCASQLQYLLDVNNKNIDVNNTNISTPFTVIR